MTRAGSVHGAGRTVPQGGTVDPRRGNRRGRGNIRHPVLVAVDLGDQQLDTPHAQQPRLQIEPGAGHHVDHDVEAA